jgi:hypothetical protein
MLFTKLLMKNAATSANTMSDNTITLHVPYVDGTCNCFFYYINVKGGINEFASLILYRV